jgi:outer membrane protein OmpA-like peptidoglycan-associated protein
MFTYLLPFLLYLPGHFPSQNVLQVENSIRISGSCRDNTTKDYLKKSIIYAGFKSGRKQVSKSDDIGNWDFRIPDTTQYLLFEVEGYHTINLPVNCIGQIASSSVFPVVVEMSLKDSLPMPLQNQLTICLSVPDSMDIDHKIAHLNSTAFSVSAFRKNNNNGKHWPFFYIEGFRPGKGLYTAYSPEGHLYVRREMKLAPGLNFADVHIEKPKELSKTNTPPVTINEIVVTSLHRKSLYFDQSSYELRNETKASLDSVSVFLKSRQEMAAHITGYTDHVGERQKNLTLSEFRAKMVMNYLTQKGVRADQINIQWKGSDTRTVTDDSEESKIRKRRVEIQFLPK